MRKKIVLFLVLIFSFNSFAAIVSDNDGSAFTTKAEFDSLKNDFQTQIDNYNTSIDSKIDGAIAAYLAGVKLSKTTLETAIFAKNAGSSNNIVCRPYSFATYARCYHNMQISLTYAVTYTRAIDGSTNGIWAKNFTGSLSKSMSTFTGKRGLVNEVKNDSGSVTGNRYVGYCKNYGEKWDINWVRDKVNVDDGFSNANPHYLQPFCWLGTQNSIFEASSSTWNNWKTSVVAVSNSSQLLDGTNVIVSVEIPDHKIENKYDFIWEDNANNSNDSRVYLWVDGQTKKFVAGKVNNQYFGYTNSDMWGQLSKGSTSMQYFDAASNGSYMNRATPTVNKGGGSGVSSTYKNYYQPMTAPLNVNGQKWSTIYYNDSNEYTYTYSASTGAKSQTKVLKNFKMTDGIPLFNIEEGQTIEWDWQFSNTATNRKIYLKPGVFSGTSTQMNNSEVVTFDASKQSGTIKYKAERSDMLFLKWTSGNTLVTGNSGSVKITSAN